MKEDLKPPFGAVCPPCGQNKSSGRVTWSVTILLGLPRVVDDETCDSGLVGSRGGENSRELPSGSAQQVGGA